MTFHDYFAKAQSIKGLDKALWPVLKSITSAAVKVSHDLQKAALLDGILGAQGEQNVQGEDQGSGEARRPGLRAARDEGSGGALHLLLHRHDDVPQPVHGRVRCRLL